jgi:hypothetical protein
MTGQPGVCQVLMLDAHREVYEQWLASHGLELRPVPTNSDDDLPTYVVSPTDAAMRRHLDG